MLRLNPNIDESFADGVGGLSVTSGFDLKIAAIGTREICVVSYSGATSLTLCAGTPWNGTFAVMASAKLALQYLRFQSQVAAKQGGVLTNNGLLTISVRVITCKCIV